MVGCKIQGGLVSLSMGHDKIVVVEEDVEGRERNIIEFSFCLI